MKIIKGFKGGKSGGGGGKTSVESPDSLRSRQYARLIDLICEGEVEGLATGDLRSVYLDKTPVMNEDGSYNFTGVTFAFRSGSQAQSYISGFPDVEAENTVGVKVNQASPVVRSISSPAYDAARVTIGIPSLYSTNTANGNTSGTDVSFKISLQSNGGSYVDIYEETISGKTTTRYQKSYLVPLTGSAPWNIRVTRVTPDSATAYVQNDLYFDSFTEITHAKLRYPNSALAASIIDSQQFSSIPNRGYDMKLLIIQIPSNATVRADGSLTYSGTWDGTFQLAWSSNPAWVFYDMIVNSRYGLGDFIDVTQIDKWQLYSIGRYCDELVPDGFGGTEPRFSCNIYIQEQREAFNVIRDLSSIFRGIVFWANAQITAVQDAPSDPIALYTNANVIDGLFTYEGTSGKARHTVALVNWNDPSDFYSTNPEYVEDVAGIARYGIITTNVVAMGCTSRGQAHRVGQWLLYSEINETENVKFRAGLDGANVRPGHIINVHDRNRVGTRLGGRIISATTTAITIDSPFTPIGGQTYTFNVALPDGTVGVSVVSSIVGNVLNLTTPLAAAPIPNAIWMVKCPAVQLQTFRVLSVVSTDDNIEILALKHNSEKYDAVENNLILAERQISTLTVTPAAPQNLQIYEELYEADSTIKTVVRFVWDQVSNADTYTVTYKVDSNNPVTVQGIKSQIFEVRDAITGLYAVTVQAVSVIGKPSAGAEAQKRIFGKTAKPLNVQNFSMVGVSNGMAQMTWDQATDLDVLVGGYVWIRHTPDIVTPAWNSAIDIGPALAGSVTSASLPHIDGTYLAKFVDSSDNSSEVASTVTTRTASLVAMNVISLIDESSFTGVKTNCIYPTPIGGLGLTSDGIFSTIPLFSSLTSLFSYGTMYQNGTYEFANYFDLGGVFISRVTAEIGVLGYDQADIFSNRTDLISLWSSFVGVIVDDVNAILYIATTNDDPAGSPTWSSWRPFFVGQYECRAYKFMLGLTSGFATHNIDINTLKVTIDMPDRTEAQRNLTTTAAPYNVTFPTGFKAIPAIGITANNLSTGDYFVITGQTATGFTIEFKNSGGSSVARNFDYIAKGYGYAS